MMGQHYCNPREGISTYHWNRFSEWFTTIMQVRTYPHPHLRTYPHPQVRTYPQPQVRTYPHPQPQVRTYFLTTISRWYDELEIPKLLSILSTIHNVCKPSIPFRATTMAGGSRSKGKRSTSGAGTSQQNDNDGAYRSSWCVPVTTEEWAEWGRTRADYPFTEEETAKWNAAWEQYYLDHRLNEPPTYQYNQSEDVTGTQRMPSPVKRSIDDENGQIDNIKHMWNQNRGIIQGKKDRLEEMKQDLAQRKREVRDLQKQIRELQDDITELTESYTGMEEVIAEKVAWITKMQDLYP